MLVQTTLDTLNRLKLYGMAAALAEQLTNSAAASLSFEERLGLLVDREVLHRDNRRLTRLLQLAQLKHRNACIEDVDYRASRRLDRGRIASLASCDWIRQAHNLLISCCIALLTARSTRTTRSIVATWMRSTGRPRRC